MAALTARRLSESTSLAGLLPDGESRRRSLRLLEHVRAFATTKETSREAVRLLAKVDMNVCMGAIRMAAPAQMFVALYVLPLVVARFIVAKVAYRLGGRR
jgi:hypothetical protein